VVSGRSRIRRLASVVMRCPAALAQPVTRRLLLTAGIAFAGWLLGAAGQAHADTASGARLPSVAAYTGAPVATVTGDMPLVRRVVPAVRTSEAALRPSRPPAILALPPAAAPVLSGIPRPRASVDTGGPSRTRRHADPDAHAAIGGGPLTHTGPHAVTGASEKASTAAHAARSTVPAPVLPRLPRPLPHRAQTLPPPVAGGIDQPGLCRTIRLGAACRRALISALLTGAVPPVVRTAADEPTFSPD
jgi:hypothetical protein